MKLALAVAPGGGATADALFAGRVSLLQPARGVGYRANVDALLLASFAARGRRARLALDLGAGSGAVALSLLHLDAADRVVLVEVDPAAAEMATHNLAENGWSTRGEVECCDVRETRRRRQKADLVVCNPPYVAPGKGRPAKGEARAKARAGDISLFVKAARASLARRGRACFVYPARELATLLVALRGAGLEAKRLRMVHATATASARLALVEVLAAKPGGLEIEPPLIERSPEGYTAEMTAVLGTGAIASSLRP